MRTSITFDWFSSIIIFIFTFSSILVCAAPAPEANIQNHPVKTLNPHYIVHAKEAFPDQAFATSYTGEISFTSRFAGNEIILYVGFDVPSNGAEYCFIKFKLPPRELDPNGYPWSVSGSGKFDVYPLDGIIRVGHLTWNRRLARASQDPIAQVVQPKTGGPASVNQRGFRCLQGQRMDFEIRVTPGGPCRIHWYQLESPEAGITLEMYN